MPAGTTEAATVAPDEIRGRWLRELWASSIGQKIVVAVTGVILALYVVAHALGNLKAFQGAGGETSGESIDKYAEWLRTIGNPAIPHEGLLWLIRVVLITALVLHIAAIVQLTRRNSAARPVESGRAKRVQRSLAARTTLITGVLILAFVVFHVLHFTTRTIQTTPVIEGAVYENMYEAFSEWYFVLVYVVAVLALGFHLWHGIWSATQTWGSDKPNRNPTIRRFAAGTAVTVTIAFAAVPVAFWVDLLPEPYTAGGQAAVGGIE